MKFVAFTTTAYGRLVRAASWLQSPLLLLIRLCWGYQFMTAGWGKLINHAKPTEYFESLGIPFPGLSAWMAGGAECICGALLMVGLASRAASIPLIFTMVVAYATTEKEALGILFHGSPDPEVFFTDSFTSAAPFLFLLASLIVLAFGPGAISIDHLIARKYRVNRG